MFQTHRKCINTKPEENMQMSGTGSSSQSEYSAYTVSTNANSKNFVNFQQRFKHFNPEAHTPHSFDTNSVGGHRFRDGNKFCDKYHNNSVQSDEHKPNSYEQDPIRNKVTSSSETYPHDKLK